MSEGFELLGERESYGFKEPVYLARRADGQFLRLSRLLHLVAAEADGQKDYGQIALRVSRPFGRTVSADNVRFLVEERLRPLGVLAATDAAITHQPAKLPRAKPVLALSWRVPILPAGAARALARVFRPLFFAPVVVAVLAGFAALDSWLFFVHGLNHSARQVLYQPELFLMIFGLGVFSDLFHECGHATACHHGGAKPGKLGVGIYLVWPVFYSDVTEAYRLGRTGRLRTDLGGVYFDAIFSLATAGAYFLSGFEPLLLVIFLQQVQMLYQFMPFLRLDGYYLVSDITGVPDLFARIRPILASMIPGSRPGRQVEELKPWARAVVTAWVLAVIPVLLCLLAVLIVSAPQLYATAWDSFFVHYDKVRDALGGGRVAEAMAGLLQVGLLVIPVAGVTLTFALVGKGLSTALWRSLEGKPLLRISLAIAAVGFAGGYAGATLAERALLASSFSALTATVSSAASAIAEPIVGSLSGTAEEKRRLLGLGIILLTYAFAALIVARKLPMRRTTRREVRPWRGRPTVERRRRVPRLGVAVGLAALAGMLAMSVPGRAFGTLDHLKQLNAAGAWLTFSLIVASAAVLALLLAAAALSERLERIGRPHSIARVRLIARGGFATIAPAVLFAALGIASTTLAQEGWAVHALVVVQIALLAATIGAFAFLLASLWAALTLTFLGAPESAPEEVREEKEGTGGVRY